MYLVREGEWRIWVHKEREVERQIIIVSYLKTQKHTHTHIERERERLGISGFEREILGDRDLERERLGVRGLQRDCRLGVLRGIEIMGQGFRQIFREREREKLQVRGLERERLWDRGLEREKQRG